ncbi:UNVERIFIED_CONTAM: hypothetical protein Sindi_0980200 [Sesamum indicum]
MASASASERAAEYTNSSSDSLGTPGTPGSNESIPEEFYAFKDLRCPELFRETVPRNSSTPQGERWVAEIMTTPHTSRFYDNIRMTKACFYTLIDALTSRGLLPHGNTSRVSSIEEVALFMQTVSKNDNVIIWSDSNTHFRLFTVDSTECFPHCALWQPN